MKYIIRLTTLPFVLCLHLIYTVRLLIKVSFYHIKYGTEMFTHMKANREKSTADMLEYLKNKLEQENKEA